MTDRPYDASPLVSIGLPTRNRAHLLPRSLGSLLAQTYENIEFIVSDNASTDTTESLLRSYAMKDPRIRYIRQPRDINGMENHEFVLRQARGAYFMWASDDDWWAPTFVESMVKVLESRPEYGVAMSYYYKRYIHTDNPRIEKVTHDFTDLSHIELFKRYLRGRITPIFFFGLYRRELLQRIFTRKTPSCYNGLMLTLSEVALATRCFSFPEFLHEQEQDTRSYVIRHPTNPYTFGVLDAFAVARYVFKIPVWLVASPVIPLSRKFQILFPWIRRAWLYKRKIFRELWRYVKYTVLPVTETPDRLIDQWLHATNYVVLAHTLFLLGKLKQQSPERMRETLRARERLFEKESDQWKKLLFLETRFGLSGVHGKSAKISP